MPENRKPEFRFAANGDPINPPHYRGHPSGVECIEITEHMPFCIGTAMKYLWRCDLKHPDPEEDLLKAIWYIRREIDRRKRMRGCGV
jgi:hypothetical protein